MPSPIIIMPPPAVDDEPGKETLVLLLDVEAEAEVEAEKDGSM